MNFKISMFSIAFLFIYNCKEEKTVYKKEDFSQMFEIAFNACGTSKKYYNLKDTENARKIIKIVVAKNSSFKKQIKIFNITAIPYNMYVRDGNLWILIVNYEYLKDEKFYLTYEIYDEKVFIETTLIKKNGVWLLSNCNIKKIK